MKEYWIEAESFAEKGGWIVDQQSMETLGSSYLMAHGMGIPVADAVHTLSLSEGTYHIWVRCRDWTAPWDVAEPAGKFRLLVDGKETETVLGTNGPEWGWQKAGVLPLQEGSHELRLRDLTGFNGRCDGIYLTTAQTPPPDGKEEIAEIRRRLNGDEATEEETYDLIVAGGGIAGICTALAALRSGVRTLLIHDRPVLGGCNSSEIRVCIGGTANLPPYPNLGNVVKEIAPVMGHPTKYAEEYFEDSRKKFAFEASRAGNCLRLNEAVTDVEYDTAPEGRTRITGIRTTHVQTGKVTRYRANYFADCTGDGILARKAGCRTMYGRESRETFGESLAPEKADRMVMGHSIRWYSEATEHPTPFPDLNWNMPFDDETCLNAENGDWEQETGFRRHMVDEIEYIRDFGLRAIYANWSYQKNHYKNKDRYANRRLKWVSPYGGKRESFRVVGDFILTQRDIEDRPPYPDGTACLSWSIDFHFPEPDNERIFGEAFRSFAYHRGLPAPYPVPYRCLCAADAENLFLGGRLVSVSHVAFGSVRVMRTLGQLGEVIGLAASVCKEKNCTPRQVWQDHFDRLKEKMTEGVPIPSAFSFEVEEEEKYHYKDLGWVHLFPTRDWDRTHTEKIRRDIRSLGLSHKYPLPPELDGESPEDRRTTGDFSGPPAPRNQ